MTSSKNRKADAISDSDAEIDYSDIPETDEAFWQNAELITPDQTQPVTLRVKKSVLDYFKQDGAKGYQTRINAVLETYVRARQNDNAD